MRQATYMASGGRCYNARAGQARSGARFRRARARGRRCPRQCRAAGLVRDGGRALSTTEGFGTKPSLAAEEALPVAWEIGEWAVVFFSSAWLAIAYLKLGQPDKARRVLDRVFNEAPARIVKSQAYAIAYAQIALAQIHLTTGQLQRGPEYRSPGAAAAEQRLLPSRRSRGPSRSRASPRSDGRSGRGRRRVPPQPRGPRRQSNVLPNSLKRCWPMAASAGATMRRRTGR